MNVCEEASGLPCIDGGELTLPDGEAAIIGILEPFDQDKNTGTVLTYTDQDGKTWDHEFTDPHQLIALADDQGNTAILIISDRLDYTGQGIKG